ncbi:MAG TPA: single-stranded DNA-binding protein [Polyangiaceae bacterium]|nr:single-stranded DNA-binding protein [Polyangiaceae bacterium]
MNRVTLLGNLGSDPELRTTANGGVLKMRLATSEAWLGKDGKLVDHTEWHDVALFGKRAEALSRILAKGDRVVVEGALRTSSYEAKDGGTRYRTEVLAKDVILAGGRRRSAKDVAADVFGGIDDVPTEQLPPPSSRVGTLVADVTAG